MNLALLKNNIIENVIIIESLELAQELFPDYDYYVMPENAFIGIGWYRENDLWYPPKPSEDYVWNEELWTWVDQNFNTETPSFEHSVEYLSEQS